MTNWLDFQGFFTSDRTMIEGIEKHMNETNEEIKKQMKTNAAAKEFKELFEKPATPTPTPKLNKREFSLWNEVFMLHYKESAIHNAIYAREVADSVIELIRGEK